MTMEKKQLQQQGQHIYKKSEVLRDIAEFMEHPVSRQFYEKYLQHSKQVPMVLDVLFLYANIDRDKTMNLTPYEKITLLMDVIIRQQHSIEIEN